MVRRTTSVRTRKYSWDKKFAHVHDIAPGHIGLRGGDLGGQRVDRLADDDQVVEDRVERHPSPLCVVDSLGANELGLGALGPLDGIQDVLKSLANRPTGTRAHSGTASANARSATSGRSRSTVAMSTRSSSNSDSSRRSWISA